MNRCVKCGGEYPAFYVRCPSCGTPITWKPNMTEEESKKLKRLMKDIELSKGRLAKIKSVAPK